MTCSTSLIVLGPCMFCTDIECKHCKQRQAVTTFVHPVTGFTMRGYDPARLIAEVTALQAKTAPARRAARILEFADTQRKKQELTMRIPGVLNTQPDLSLAGAPTRAAPKLHGESKEPRADVALGANNAAAHVPKDASAGDVLVLFCNDGRRVQVIVAGIES